MIWSWNCYVHAKHTLLEMNHLNTHNRDDFFFLGAIKSITLVWKNYVKRPKYEVLDAWQRLQYTCIENISNYFIVVHTVNMIGQRLMVKFLLILIVLCGF